MDNKNVKNKIKNLRQSLTEHKLQNRLAVGLLIATTVFSGAMSLQTMGSTGDPAMASSQSTEASVSQNRVDLVGETETAAETEATVTDLSQGVTTRAAEALSQTGGNTIAEAKRKSDEEEARVKEEAEAAKKAKSAEEKAAKAKAAREKAAREAASAQEASAETEDNVQDSGSADVSATSPYFGSNGLLVMAGTGNARRVASLLLSIPGHRNGAAYHKSTGLDSLIDSLSVEEATWVVHTIEGRGFGQTGSGYAGVDSHASHQAFLTKQVNRRFGGNIRTLLKRWGTFSYGGY